MMYAYLSQYTKTRKVGELLKLSIIVPFHEGEAMLADCFESIAIQHLSDYEVILILDHVTEDISPVLAAYEGSLPIKKLELSEPIFLAPGLDPAIIQEKHLTHSGAAAARNAGLRAATGEYVYFLDSDDYLMEGALPLLLAEADARGVDLAYGAMQYSWFKRKVYLSSIEVSTTNDDGSESGKNSAADTDAEGEGQTEEKRAAEERRQQRRDELSALMPQRQEMVDVYFDLFGCKRNLANVSVLNILFRRGFLAAQQLYFDEEFRFFSDLIFMSQALPAAKTGIKVEGAAYIKRKHNDPIHYPALCQAKLDTKVEELFAAYQKSRACTGDPVVQRFLDSKLFHFYLYTFANRIRNSENPGYRGAYFDKLASLLRAIPAGSLPLRSGYEKRMLKAAGKGNPKTALLHVNFHLGWKKLKKIRHNRRVFAYYLYFKFFSKMSVKENWVNCESFFGKSYSDSPKYIYEYLCKNYPGKYKFIWTINDRTKIPFHPVKVKRFSIRHCYYLARCKYTVFNCRQPEWMRKREGNVFLQTWHGTPLKRLVFDQEEVCGASPLYKAQFYRQSRIWDYLVSANHFSTECFRSAFLFDNPILEYGYPRNDILYSERKEELAQDLKRKLGIPAGKKTILYAPTWRDDEYYGRGQYKFQLKLDLPLLRKLLGDDYIVLLRTHYFIADNLDVAGLEDFVVNVSKYDDISELYLISDMLITDYSSVFFDYANLMRPVLFYTYDLDKYRDMLRGFYLDIEKEVPGPLLFTTEEVADAVQNIDQVSEAYKTRYAEFYQRFCSLDDGHASEKIAKEVFGLE